MNHLMKVEVNCTEHEANYLKTHFLTVELQNEDESKLVYNLEQKNGLRILGDGK